MPEWLNPAIEAAGSVASGFLGGLFNANQAKKNRQFQERMYYKQLEDNRKILEDARAYALPSAELQRLKDAHLNPLLYYGQGGSMSQITPAQSASAPHGAQASAQFQNPFQGFTANSIAMQKLQAEIDLLKSERDKNEADKEKAESETSFNDLQTQWNKDSYNVRLWIQYGEYDKLRAYCRDVSDQIIQRGFLNTQTAATMAQARIYEIKRFDMDFNQISQMLEQGWQNVKVNQQHATAALRNASANWLNALTNRYIAKWQVGAMAQDIYYKSLEQPYKLKNMGLQNLLNKYDVRIKSQDLLKGTQENQFFRWSKGMEKVPIWAAPFFIWSAGVQGNSF